MDQDYRSVDYWNDVAKTWRDKPLHTFWRLYSDMYNSRLLARWLPDGRAERLLKTDLFDESLSQGLYPLLASRTKDIFGIDLSILTVQGANSRHANLRVMAADVRSLPFDEGVFDVIVSNSTLDHFESSDQIITSLGELHRVLKKGGQLLITLDNQDNPLIALRNYLPFEVLHRLKLVPYYVGMTFGPKQLKQALQQLNFEVIEVSAIIHFPRVIAVPIVSILEKFRAARIQRAFLRFLYAVENLSKLPTQFITGHFVAVKAIKR